MRWLLVEHKRWHGWCKTFAGNALTNYMGPGGVTAGNLAANFAPDLVFGAMQGAMTPGDLGDKLIAGTSTAVGGAWVVLVQ